MTELAENMDVQEFPILGLPRHPHRRRRHGAQGPGAIKKFMTYASSCRINLKLPS
jgi:hypothetical protein